MSPTTRSQSMASTSEDTGSTIMASPSSSVAKSGSKSGTLYFYTARHSDTYAPFSQWYPCTFKCPTSGITYTSTEQYMMHRKALLFAPGSPICDKILSNSNPASIKKLGRQIPGFSDDVWERERENIVEMGNYLKFSQVDGLKDLLQGTGEREIVEASARDRIWGIGFTTQQKPEEKRDQWGLNLLGKCLMKVRETLKLEEGGQSD
ncbi:Similar to Uncharacterized protein R617; acc. no. Q5UR67 [Pyronema omphalodes CBS 100304]|uniref:Similar to Uncharacterized protein R617 acc. no. Q5UR67 n=1 Tax=Pyronema omphalodes (strain CBS 100304) TaxID=1076935 RepID=U4KYC6_PYROM|nr:Similar to Uncharacterized protein R617; acc. no. Q5UR67 [Pyronema omphalodes CBS 100304]